MITLLSDFGLTDPYVAQMKAIILSGHNSAQIVDISHGIEKHNIAMGSYILETTVPFFPRDSIHVAVVDPGVGSSRLPTVIACDRGILIGPDNGLLARAARKLGFRAAYRIENSEFKRTPVSHTFHGRDIFAQTAMEIAEGHSPSEAGPEIAQLVSLDRADPVVSKSQVSCSVLYVDSFGNLVTNLTEDKLHGLLFRGKKLRLKTGRVDRQVLYVESYSEIPKEKLGIIQGSHGYLEVATKEGSAAQMLKLKPFDQLDLSLN